MPVRLAALVVLLCAAPAAADRRYERCPAVPGTALVQIARAGCDEAGRVAAALVLVTPGAVADTLRAEGWTPYRAQDARGDRFDVVALRGTAALRVRRAGEAPDLDGWAAGRELVFARSRLVGGRPVPRGTSVCSSAFLVRRPGGALGGLSAAHCGGLRSDGTVQRRNAALRRPPQPGIVLGRVNRILSRRDRLDALLLPVVDAAARPVVDRGIARPPWIVAGPGSLRGARRVCFTGRTSGTDRCGRLRGGRRAGALERALERQADTIVRCTTVRARQGDSGGPAYSAPAADGTVRAMGIVALAVGASGSMCFTPLDRVLDRLGAELVTGPIG